MTTQPRNESPLRPERKIVHPLAKLDPSCHARQSGDRESQRKQCLQEVYDCYSKRILHVQKNYTFERMFVENNMLTLGKFIQFCRDFSICDKLSPDALVSVFKKCSLHQLYIPRETFEEAIRLMGSSIFGSGSESEDRMWQFIECDNPPALRYKLSGQSMKKLRLPVANSPLRKSDAYRFKLYAHTGKNAADILQELDDRRLQKLKSQILRKQQRDMKLDMAKKKFFMPRITNGNAQLVKRSCELPSSNKPHA